MTYAELRAEALELGVRQGWLAVPLVGKKPIVKYAHLLDEPWRLDHFMGLWPDPDEDGGDIDGFGVVWPSDIVAVEADGPDGATWMANQKFPETVVFMSARGPHYLFKGRVDGLDPKPHAEVEVLGRPSKTLMFVPPMAGKSWLGGLAPGEVDFAALPALPRLRHEPRAVRHALGGDFVDRAESQGRNVALTSVAGALRNQGLDEEGIFAALDAINNQLPSPLPMTEIGGIARSSSSWAVAEDDKLTPLGRTIAAMDFWLDWDGEDEPYDWLYYPLLPREADVRMYGPSGSAKSMLACWIAAHLSHEGIASSYYSEENPRSTDRKRLRRMRPDPVFFRLASNKGINLADPDAVERMIERDKDRDLIILDTYSHTYAPQWEVDRNQKAVDHGKVVDGIIEGTGACVVTIDHTGFRGEEMRDASAKRQQSDIAILVDLEEDWKGPGHPAKFSLRNMKATRFGNPFRGFGQVVDELGSGLGVQWGWRTPDESWGARGVVRQ